MKSPKQLFINLPIRRKILICMLIIALTATGIVSVMYYSAMYRDYIDTAQASATSKVASLSSTLNDNLSALFFNTFRFLGSDEVNAVFTTAMHGQDITANALADVADRLDLLVRTNNLIDTILLIGDNKAYYSSKNIRLKPEHQNADIWDDHGEERVTWLSARKTPYVVPNKEVIPLSFSLSQRRNVEQVMPSLVSNRENLTLRLFIFFDYVKFKNLLQVDDTDRLGTTYIAGEDLRPLSVSEDAVFHPVATDPAFIEGLGAIEGSGEIRLEERTYIVYASPINVTGLSVINITDKAELLSGLSAIVQLLVISVCITVVSAIALSAALARITTRPLNKLVAHVRGIEKNGTSHPPFITQYTDEIGVLGTSINTMLSTIGQHMQTIQEEERKRHNAEIKVLTQQINPHFIYNTLDCIRWEILNGNTEGSSNMVEALAKFLRLGFGHASDLVTLEEEVIRVEQYIQIMRYRLCGSIRFTSYVQQELTGFQIPKMSLQPMIENSVKHGFGEALPMTAYEAELHIDARIEDGVICLGVEDNGAGINIEKAQESLCLERDDAQRDSLGLYNSFLRMRAVFGAENVEIRFTTTPYFINRVEYRIRALPEATPPSPAALP